MNNSEKNINRQKLKTGFCLFIAVIFAVYFALNWQYILIEESFNKTSLIKLLILTVTWLAGIGFNLIPLHFPDKITKILQILYMLVTPFVTFVLMEIAVHNLKNIFRIRKLAWAYNIIVIFLVEFLLTAIFNRISIGVAVCTMIFVIFSVVNWFVYEFRGVPIIASDLATAGTALDVAGSYAIRFNFASFFVLLALFAFIMIGINIASGPVFKKKRYWLCSVAGMLVLSVGFTNTFVMSDFLKNRDIVLRMFRPMSTYHRYGSVLAFCNSIYYATPEKPEGYSVKAAEEIASKYSSDKVDTEKERPNMFVIINEAFSDLSVLGDFETNEDYMPFIRSLKDADNCITGTSYSSVLGGMTANTEFEFLTENSMAFLPPQSVSFQLYVNSQLPTLTYTAKDEGYVGGKAVHLLNPNNYRRNLVYPYLGFEDFINIDTEGVNPQLIRKYATDESTYDILLKDYEKYRETTEAPYYGYTMTIQNHSPYDMDYDNYEERIKLKDIDAPDMDQYLSLIKYSDDYFKELTEYFEKIDEPTVIFMVGDHQPNISDEFLNAVCGKKWKKWGSKKMMKRYAVPFVIWANYDIEEQTVEKTSMNFLQTILTEATGGEMTGYQKFLQDFREDVPVITSMGYWGKDGKFYNISDKDSPYYEKVHEYSILQYNNLMDSKHRISGFFELKK